MSSGPIHEVSIQVNADRPVALIGEAGQVSARATAHIEHRRERIEERRKGSEGDRRPQIH
jgi:hypothetical protein